jgi:hypothetical protein
MLNPSLEHWWGNAPRLQQSYCVQAYDDGLENYVSTFLSAGRILQTERIDAVLRVSVARIGTGEPEEDSSTKDRRDTIQTQVGVRKRATPGSPRVRRGMSTEGPR